MDHRFEPFDLPSGRTADVRGLSGYEVMLATKKYDQDSVEYTAMLLGISMGGDEARGLAWMKDHLAGDMQALVAHVQEISGLTARSAKEAYKSLRDRPSDGV